LHNDNSESSVVELDSVVVVEDDVVVDLEEAEGNREGFGVGQKSVGKDFVVVEEEDGEENHDGVVVDRGTVGKDCVEVLASQESVDRDRGGAAVDHFVVTQGFLVELTCEVR